MREICEGVAERKQQQARNRLFQTLRHLSDHPKRDHNNQLHMVPKIRSKNRHKSPPLHSNRPPHPISPLNRRKLGLSAIIGWKLVVPTRGGLVQLLMIMNISLIARTLRGRAACSSDLLCFKSTSSSCGLWTEGLRARGSLIVLCFCILCCRGFPFCGSQLRVR